MTGFFGGREASAPVATRLLAKAERMLMIPDYFHWRLTGKAVNEYTNATTTQLVSAEKKDWDWELLDRLELPRKIFGHSHRGQSELGLTQLPPGALVA